VTSKGGRQLQRQNLSLQAEDAAKVSQRSQGANPLLRILDLAELFPQGFNVPLEKFGEGPSQPTNTTVWQHLSLLLGAFSLETLSFEWTMINT
jgi:hypothetical protein